MGFQNLLSGLDLIMMYNDLSVRTYSIYAFDILVVNGSC